MLHPLTTLHPLPRCTLHARTAPPLARLHPSPRRPSPCCPSPGELQAVQGAARHAQVVHRALGQHGHPGVRGRRAAPGAPRLDGPDPHAPYISLHLPRSPCTCLHLPIPHQVGHISMGQIHLLVLCKPHLADSISEVETGSVSLGGRVQPDRHCNLQPHAPQPAPRLVTACTLARCRRAWAAWAPTRAGSPSPSACARPTCASSTRTSPRTRARSTC